MSKRLLSGLGLALLTACAPKGQVEGDVFYLSKGGDVKHGAGLTVELLRSDSLLPALDENCRRYRTKYAPLECQMNPAAPCTTFTRSADWHEPFRQADSLWASTMLRADSIIATRVVRRTNSGANSHYLFTEVPSGEYFIFTRWGVGVQDTSADMPLTAGLPEHLYQWLSPVDVRGAKLKLDLDTDGESGGRIYCGIK